MSSAVLLGNNGKASFNFHLSYVYPTHYTKLITPQKKRSKFPQRLHCFSLKVHLSNIRGLHCNFLPAQRHLETSKPHFLFLTETQILCYTLEYNFLQRAGVCVFICNNNCCQHLRHLEHPKFSTLWMLVDTGVDKIVYVYNDFINNTYAHIITFKYI